MQDIRLTFTNAMTYNPVGHPVHVFAAKLLEDFEAQLVDVVTERIGVLLAGSEHVDTWLGRYPLNSEIEREAVEGRNGKVKGAGGGVKDGSAAVGLPSQASRCDTSRVRPPETSGEVSMLDETGVNSSCGETAAEGSWGVGGDMTTHESDGEDMQSDGEPSVRSCESMSELWPQRPVNSRASVCPNSGGGSATERHWGSPVVDTPFDKPQLGLKGVVTLMSELSRHVCRLKEDMYVITFSSRDAQHKKCQRGISKGTALSSRGKGNNKVPLGSLGQTTRGSSDTSKLRLSHDTISESCLDMLVDIAPDTSDPDDVRRSYFADSRQTFLELSQYRHLQFDSLRRAKHSSMMILFHLLHPQAKYIRPVCCECDKVILETRWHCNQCISGDYDVCGACMSAPWYTHAHAGLTPMRVPLV